jgi:hypothetical protein
VTLALREPKGIVRRVAGIVGVGGVTGGVTGRIGVPDFPVVKVRSLVGAFTPEAVERILK